MPLFFVAVHDRTEDSEFITELFTRRKESEIKDAIRQLDKSDISFSRKVKGLLSDSPAPSGNIDQEISSPNLRTARIGRWKTLGQSEIGEDQDGNMIVGKTWVEDYSSWSQVQTESFLMRKKAEPITGDDPGIVYVMRSPAHDVDIFKIGLTRREVELRAGELSHASGVPLPFGIMCHWQVGDCAQIERAIHVQLAKYRVSNKREFFKANLSLIISTIESVIHKQGE